MARERQMSLPAPSPSSAALVTGASAGIGSEIARELARRGHGVVLVARRKEKLDELAGELHAEYGIRAEAIGCDLSKAASRQRLPARVASLGLDIEILVNNAGFATGGAFHESDPARELEQVRVLVEAVVALTSAFLPAMVQRGRGAILNVASTAGMQPLPFSAGYSAAKAYVLTFSEALHQELHGAGVTVTALAPGPVSTEFWDVAGWEVAGGQAFEKAVPRPAWVTAAETAKAGVDGLAGGRRVVVPGFQVRTAMLAARYVPNALKLPALGWIMRRR
jgi:short-subunit dehydrogenase